MCDVCSSALSVDSSTAGSAEKVKPIELVYDTEATFGPSYSECAKNPALIAFLIVKKTSTFPRILKL